MWYKVHISAVDCKSALAAAPYHPTEIYTVIWSGYFTVQWTSNAVPSHHTSPLARIFSHTHSERSSQKMWNGANAQGKYNTISTSTVSRYLWKQLNTKKSRPLFFFFASCKSNDISKVVRVCLLNEGWMHLWYLLSFSFSIAPLSNCVSSPSVSFHPSTFCCATLVNITEHRVVESLLQIHLGRQKRCGIILSCGPILWKKQNTCACLVCFCLFSG